jgi:phosphatidylinositol 3-kinase
VEILDPNHGSRYREVFAALQERLSATPLHFKNRVTPSASDSLSASVSTTLSLKRSIVDSVSKLGSSLRGTEPSTSIVADPFAKTTSAPKFVWDLLLAEDRFISGVMDIQMRSRDARGKKDSKEAHLRSSLATEGFDRSTRREPVPLPTAPYIMVNGVNPQTAKIFKSALYPALIEFHVESMSEHHEDFVGKAGSVLLEKPSGATSLTPRSSNHVSSYKVIVKTGDDLRQDQLIIMMIQLMDGLLKRVALDMCLTPYSIIAMSPTSGLVEFVDGSVPISQILAKHNNSILNFFQAFAPQAGAKYNVRPDVIATYVRSCAGYCVITYLLGVGDRHLDNILLQPSGHFFHIDFGFIFGRDPKPLPPAFRLTREV